MNFEIKKAKREKLKAAINLVGASSSGKTVGALSIAYGMMKTAYPGVADSELWGKISLVDTEHKRSLIYAEMERPDLPVSVGEFLHIDFTPPHTTERYLEAIRLAKKHSEVVVVDSMSHAWQELLQMQQNAGGRYQDWKDIRPLEKQLWAELFDKNDCHVITTTRAKQEYAMEKGGDDKLKVTKLGTKPVQNDQLEYEYMISFLIDPGTHLAIASKDNSGMFSEVGKIGVSHGEKIYKWLEKGEDVKAREREDRTLKSEMIADMVDKYEFAAKELAKIEKHPSVKTKLADMTYDWVVKTFNKLSELTEAHLRKEEYEAEAEQQN